LFCAVPVTNFSLLEKRVHGKAGHSSNSEAQQIFQLFFVPLTKRKEQQLFCPLLSLTKYGYEYKMSE